MTIGKRFLDVTEINARRLFVLEQEGGNRYRGDDGNKQDGHHKNVCEHGDHIRLHDEREQRNSQK